MNKARLILTYCEGWRWCVTVPAPLTPVVGISTEDLLNIDPYEFARLTRASQIIP